MSALRHKSFKVFDATLFSNKNPNSPWDPIQWLYSGQLWDPGEDRSILPRREKIHDLAIGLDPSRPLFLDIEHWPLWRDADGLYRESMVVILKWFKQSNPKLQVGYYGMAPRANYNDSIGDRLHPQFSSWLRDCRIVSEIADHSDILFPVLYTYVDSPLNWRIYAERNIAEAYRYRTNAKVYAFLWPQYHESHPVLRLQYINTANWVDQLKICYSLCDGIVIWGGYQQVWDETSPWWVETKNFILQTTTRFQS